MADSTGTGSRGGAEGREVRTAHGTLELWSPAGGIFCTRGRGVMENVHAEAYCEFGESIRVEVPGRTIGLHDWVDVEGYSSDVRRIVTRWGREAIGDFEQVHVHLRSKVLAMGVSLASSVLGFDIRIHRERESFEATMAELVARRLSGS